MNILLAICEPINSVPAIPEIKRRLVSGWVLHVLNLEETRWRFLWRVQLHPFYSSTFGGVVVSFFPTLLYCPWKESKLPKYSVKEGREKKSTQELRTAIRFPGLLFSTNTVICYTYVWLLEPSVTCSPLRAALPDQRAVQSLRCIAGQIRALKRHLGEPLSFSSARFYCPLWPLHVLERCTLILKAL